LSIQYAKKIATIPNISIPGNNVQKNPTIHVTLII